MSSVTIKSIKAGDGVTYPEKGNLVSVHYIGTIEQTGVEFDSTYKRHKPFQFRIGSDQVVPGLEVAVKCLSLGERANTTIPASLAFGDRGLPGLIPSKASIIFELELLEIKTGLGN